MNVQLHLSERMPAVASGATRWSQLDEEHLSACQECRTEWILVQQTAGLGQEVERTLDLAAVEAGVLTGLRSRARPRTSRPLVWLVPLAAAAALGLVVMRSTNRVTAPDAPVLLPELETLSTTELESILTLLPAGGTQSTDGFEDLTESELSSVLTDLEG